MGDGEEDRLTANCQSGSGLHLLHSFIGEKQEADKGDAWVLILGILETVNSRSNPTSLSLS